MLTEKIKKGFYTVNILGLDASVMILERKISEDGETAQLLCSSISCTAHVTLDTVNRAVEKEGEWREKRRRKRVG